MRRKYPLKILIPLYEKISRGKIPLGKNLGVNTVYP
jgi:hypothetical protein